MTTDNLPDRVRIVEVGPRDGLQNEQQNVSVADKIAFVNALTASGLSDVEVTSFVNPTAVPQLADAEEVLAGIEMPRGVTLWVLIPNMRGWEQWLTATERFPTGSKGIAVFTAASETFNQKNIHASVAESLDRFTPVLTAARSLNERPKVRAYISMAFVSPYEGERIEAAVVSDLCERLFDMGADEISLGDTVGLAGPSNVSALLEELLETFEADRLAMHFHDTWGRALANTLLALEYGVSIFDSSAGGLGGCPFAPGATGNLATEDLADMLKSMGISTGVSLGKIAEASHLIAPCVAHPLPSKVLQALDAQKSGD